VDELTKRKRSAGNATPEAERRRIGKVVHDERGNASIKWRDAPADLERPVLEVLGEPSLTLKNEESYDPYARRSSGSGDNGAGNGGGSGSRGGGARTDLRKLSEWIKMMREREARKRNGDD
jgi:hypothetical protein